MKTRRAQEHFNALEIEIDKWLNLPPYTVAHETDFDEMVEIWRITMKPTPDPLPMLLGDFICNLRSALDQLAWGLAHLDRQRVFTEREERQISFLIFKCDDSTYRDRLKLFPSTMTSVIDNLQPHKRGNAFRDDPLWQLNELWTIDKHRAIPINSSSLNVHFPMWGWERFLRHFTYGFEVRIPLLTAWISKVEIKPDITFEILFGEYLGAFEVSRAGLRAINDFVRNDVIPKFSGFFA